MKNSIKVVCLICLLLVIGALTFHFWVLPAMTKGKMVQYVSDFRQIQLALMNYKTSGRSSQATREFPKSLQELVNGNYLAQRQLDHLSNSLHLLYHVPPDSPSPDFVVLEAFTKSRRIVITADGHMKDQDRIEPHD